MLDRIARPGRTFRQGDETGECMRSGWTGSHAYCVQPRTQEQPAANFSQITDVTPLHLSTGASILRKSVSGFGSPLSSPTEGICTACMGWTRHEAP